MTLSFNDELQWLSCSVVTDSKELALCLGNMGSGRSMKVGLDPSSDSQVHQEPSNLEHALCDESVNELNDKAMKDESCVSKSAPSGLAKYTSCFAWP
jgi:hypothetical protein